MARSRIIGPLDLSNQISQILKQYGDDVYSVLDDSVKEIADEAVSKLQSVSSFAPGRNPSGDYSKSWTSDEVPAARLQVKRVVHNEEHYRLTHLLEKGHVTRNGTDRTFRRTPAYPHIASVNEWTGNELVSVVKEKINKL